MPFEKHFIDRGPIRTALLIGITVCLIFAIELGRHLTFVVPIPFLLLYVCVVVSGNLSGKFAGVVSGLFVSAYVIYAGSIGFGPKTLTGDALQITLGALLYTGTGFLVGRIRDNRDIFFRIIQRSEANLESEVLRRTEDLRKSEGNYRSIFNNIQETFYRAGLDGRIVMVSPSVEQLLGYRSDEIIGDKLAELYVNPDDRVAFLKELETSNGQVIGYEAPLLHKDGHEVWVSTNAHYYRDEEGNILGVEGTTRDITEQKASHVRSERLTEAINRVNECVVLLDEEDRIVFVNDAWRELNSKIKDYVVPGVKFEDNMRAGIKAGLLPESLGREEEWLANRMEHHRNPSGPFDMERQEGKWIRVHEQRLPDGGTIIILSDITELKQSELQFHEILDNSPIGVSIVYHSNTVKLTESHRFFVNKALAKMFGARTEDHLLEADLSDSWVDLDRLREAEKLMTDGKQLTNFESHRRRLDGSKWWVSMNSRPIIFDGQPCIMNWHFDITEQKRVEDALRASESRLESILRIAPEAVIVIGANQNIRHFNQGAERVFGYTSKEIIGKSLDILLPPNIHAAHKKHIEDFAQAKDDFRIMDSRRDVTAIRKDGSEFPAKASLSKLDLNGEKIFVALLHDITDSKRAEAEILASKQEAEFANRAKSEFLANMSHELRTPLNAILGFSEMIKTEIWGQIGDPHYLDYADSVHVSGRHLLEIINDILDLSKIEAGKAIIENTNVDIGKTIEACLLMVCERAKMADVDLHFETSEQQSIVAVDQRHLKQILINLLSNAIKFTPSGGRISIAYQLDKDGGQEISITDTGVGIAPNNMEKVMQPFGQVANSDVRTHEGTGLGLPICKSMMELHGGSLNIESEIKKGTKATISFPPERTVHL